MNKDVIARLARLSIEREMQKEAFVGRLAGGLLRGGGNFLRGGANLGGRAMARLPGGTGARAQVLGQGLGGLAAGTVGTAGLGAGAYGAYHVGSAGHQALYPDYAQNYAQARKYNTDTSGRIKAFGKGETDVDPSQSEWGKFWTGQTHYSPEQRRMMAERMQKQLNEGNFDDRTWLGQAWDMGGWNPVANMTGWTSHGSGYYKDMADTAQKRIAETPLTAGGPSSWGWAPGSEGRRGFFGGYKDMGQLKSHYGSTLGNEKDPEHNFGWTADNPTLQRWGSFGHPGMGGTRYPMPLGLAPGLRAEDWMSRQHYRQPGSLGMLGFLAQGTPYHGQGEAQRY